MQIKSEDFKYVMHDTMRLCIGASYSYEELCKLEQTPFKLKAIIMQYISKETDKDTIVADHLTNLKDDSLCYLTFQQIKTKIKLTVIDYSKHKKGKKGNANMVMKLDEFVKFAKEHTNNAPETVDFIIEEISFSKLSLMGFSV